MKVARVVNVVRMVRIVVVVRVVMVVGVVEVVEVVEVVKAVCVGRWGGRAVGRWAGALLEMRVAYHLFTLHGLDCLTFDLFGEMEHVEDVI